MKVAHHPDSHQPLAASPDALEQAICPHCGGRLNLRRRQRMDGGCAYFWRHLDNEQRRCNGRFPLSGKMGKRVGNGRF